MENNRNEMRKDNQLQDNKDIQRSNTVKDPDEWTTGNEPMTGAQHSYLKTLSDEAGEEMNDNLTKAEASKRIEELQHTTGRGLDENNRSNETDSERATRNEEEGIRGGQSSL